jgi:hypothetical protein
MEPCLASCVEIEIKGKEKCAFTRFWTTQTNDDPPRTIEHSERVKYKHLFAHYKQPIFPIQGGCLQPGSYAISFQFVLPLEIPSSINFQDRNTRERPKAKVKYYCKAVLKTTDGSKDMKYK